MQCAAFESRLNEMLDARRSPQGDVSLAEHAVYCGACAALLHDCEMLLDSLVPSSGAGATHVQPSPDLAQRVVAQWSRQPEIAGPRDRDSRVQTLPLQRGQLRPRRFGVARWGALAAMAAAIVFVVANFVWQPGPDANQVASIHQEQAQAPISAVKPATAHPEQAAFVALATQAYRPLMEETRDGLRNALDWLPLVSPESGQFTAIEKLAPAVGQGGSGANRAAGPNDASSPIELTLLDSPITGGIAPMTQSAMRSVAVLLRVLPNGSQPLN